MSMQSPSSATKATPEEAVHRVRHAGELLRREIHKVIIGQEPMIEEMLICLFARGHCLTIGVPGLAKTLTVATLARALHLKFSRIQFTPDLMPSDITGTEIIEEDGATPLGWVASTRAPGRAPATRTQPSSGGKPGAWGGAPAVGKNLLIFAKIGWSRPAGVSTGRNGSVICPASRPPVSTGRIASIGVPP
jgi:hypothetical protein